MMQWEVAEQEGKPLTALDEAGPEPPRHKTLQWRGVVLVLLGFVAGFAGLLAWQARQRETALRADLTSVIEGEARVMGLLATEQGRAYVDPDAPLDWQMRYLRYPGPVPDPGGLPKLGTLRLEEDGQIARVEVVWPRPASRETAEAVSEHRAYRLVNGSWRRTPYVRPGQETEERRTDHFIVQAPPEELETLTNDPALYVDLESLRQSIEATWPRSWFDGTPVTVRVVAREFGPYVTPTAPHIQVNSPHLAPADPFSALPAASQYRLVLTHEVLYHLIRPPMPPPISNEPILLYRTLYDHLVFAEARQQALSAEERQAIRGQWRERLGGKWESPFSGPMFWIFGENGADQQAIERRQIALHLLLEQLAETEGPEVLGGLASAMTRQHPTEFSLADLFTEATGLSREELEARAREYAATVEE